MQKTQAKQLSSFDLQAAGQSPWLDTISRQLLNSGVLKEFVQKKGLLGVTSNPSIFQKAISSGEGYEKDIRTLFRSGKSVLEVYDALTISDIQRACDLMLPVYKKSNREHGYISLEVLPVLAYRAEETLTEARRLFKLVKRPNLMIKVPATAEGLPVIEQLIGDGINVNITLMFSIQDYCQVAEAYLRGLERRLKQKKSLAAVHSVASVFVSRIDAVIDQKLESILKGTVDEEKLILIQSLRGKAAVANSKLIYQEFKTILNSARWQKLAKAGAAPQKVLWASTSPKNPAYSPLCYVEPLVGKETVNTLPEPTWKAVLDGAKVVPDAVEEGVTEARAVIDRLRSFGIDVNAVCVDLKKAGVKLFEQAFEDLMRTLELKRIEHSPKKNPAKVALKLPEEIQDAVSSAVDLAGGDRLHSRWLEKDSSLWSIEESHIKVIRNRLGWVEISDKILSRVYEIDLLRAKLISRGIKDVVLLGMGGSSLAAEVFSIVLPRASTPALKFHLLDTTDPQAIAAVESKINLKKSFFIVASKSGGTIETVSQFQYFYGRVSKAYRGSKTETGSHFMAITDPGSGLQQLAAEHCFESTFLNPPDIGGRYSALSFFGLMGAGLCGLDIRALLKDAVASLHEMRNQENLAKNPGIYLGIILGQLAEAGVNKLTFWTTPKLRIFGDWAEQLIAESTGKQGKGIVPIVGEPAFAPDAYREDRYFVVLREPGVKTAKLDQAVKAVKKAGFPVIEITWSDFSNVGGEMLKFEIATSIASSQMAVNPFDEPNVKESKDMTGALLAQLAAGKAWAQPEPIAPVSVKGKQLIQDFLKGLKTGDYVALLGYFERNPKTMAVMDQVQAYLAETLKVPVLYGFGPRYLHSIGQLYKGGPRTGRFIELFVKDSKKLEVPSAGYSFSQLKQAQALGDYQAFASKKIPVLAVEIGADPIAGVKSLLKLLQEK